MTIVDRPKTEIHVCDNYAQLLVATADLAARRDPGMPAPVLLYLEDHLGLDDHLCRELSAVTGAEIVRASDRSEIERFARLPRWMPGIVRRNLSLDRVGRPIVANRWSGSSIGERSFDVAYVYHPGYFMSKVVSGRAEAVVMRDCGYAAYVRHRVPWSRKLPRLLAARSARWQTWGEEPWVDLIQVARPELLPSSVRPKAEPLTVDELLGRLDASTARQVGSAFWGDADPIVIGEEPTALLLTQPIDDLGMCSSAEKRDLYETLAERLRVRGYDVVVKPHPRESAGVLDDVPTLPPSFPIEAWVYCGHRPFDVAVSLNSAALAPTAVSFAARTVQLVPHERFYPAFRAQWNGHIEHAFSALPTGANKRANDSRETI